MLSRLALATMLSLSGSLSATLLQHRASAQDTSSRKEANGLLVGSKAESKKLVLAFQLKDWHTKHFKDANLAAEHAQVLKQLECEVDTKAHDGHTDVACRTVVWKSVEFDSQEQLHQWQDWMLAAGFETLHGHPASAKSHQHFPGNQREIVKYRLNDWKAQHAHKAPQLSQYLAIYRALGCETEQVDHGDHRDLRIRCTEWMELELRTHAAAHSWQEFLNKAGFETAHEH